MLEVIANGSNVVIPGIVTNYTQAVPYMIIDQGIAMQVVAAQIRDLQISIVAIIGLMIIQIIQNRNNTRRK